VVFSGDGRNFADPLEELARSGVQVVVVAFSEVAGYAISSDLLQFIDIEDVPGAFAVPLDRVRLDALPPDGAWLRPTRSLRDFVSSYASRRTGS
jgi:putative heme uptake system protein